MKLIVTLKNISECMKATIRSAISRAEWKERNPTCQIHADVRLDERSVIGSYCVLFRNVTVINSVIGDHTYVQENSIVNESEVGKYCSLAMGVSVGLPQHSIIGVSSHPAFYLRNTPLAKTYSDQDMVVVSKKTFIGPDVWIGQNAIIMNGLQVGIGAVIGAGAVVTHDVPAYAVVGGVPAKIIKYRFDEKIRNDLQESNWWNMPEKWMDDNYRLFHDPLKLLECLRAKR